MCREEGVGHDRRGGGGDIILCAGKKGLGMIGGRGGGDIISVLMSICTQTETVEQENMSDENK